MKHIFFDNFKFDNKRFHNLTKNYNTILDYGCGKGVINSEQKKIYLYDKNLNLYEYLKLKYKNNKNYIVLKKPKFKNIDVVFLNSVIQYLNEYEILKLVTKLVNNRIKLVILSDITKFSRIVEAIILFFINPIKLIKSLQYLFIKEYRKIDFCYRDLNNLTNTFKKNFKIKILQNLNDDKKTRYTLLLKIK